MKISNKYSKFLEKKAVIILSGFHQGKIIIVENGEIYIKEDFRIETPSYEGREGFFQSGTNNSGVFSSAFANENKKEKSLKELKKEFREKIKDISDEFEEVYLFSPDYLKNEMKELVSHFFKRKVIFNSGDFCSHHPFEILEILSKEEKEEGRIKKTARKILEKAKKARMIIKGKP